jgi:hypothetical protein
VAIDGQCHFQERGGAHYGRKRGCLVRNFPFQTLEISKVSLVVMGS